MTVKTSKLPVGRATGCWSRRLAVVATIVCFAVVRWAQADTASADDVGKNDLGSLLVFPAAQDMAQAKQAPETACPVNKPDKVKSAKPKTLRLPKPVTLGTARKPPTSVRPEKVVVTGSRIPQAVEPGRLLVTAAPVLVIDQTRIRRTGAQTPTEVFSRLPAAR